MAYKTFFVKMVVDSDEPDKIIECYIKQRLRFQNDIVKIDPSVDVARSETDTNAIELFASLRAAEEKRKARREGYIKGYNEAMAISTYKAAYAKGRSDERRYRREIAGS